MRIIIDTNIFISSLFWPGHSHQIIKLAEKGKVTIYASPQIIEELFKVLKRQKFQPLLEESSTTITEIFEKMLDLVSLVSPNTNVKIITADSDDNKFLACALAARASFIVSGDRHQLDLGEFKNIPILTSREFLEIIQKKSG